MDCEKVFSEPRKRRLHLVDKHHYPKYFPFDLVYTGTLSFEQRKLKDQKNKERLRRLSTDDKKNKDTKVNDVNVDEENKTKDVDMDELVTNMSKLKIPKSISFGHKAAPTIPQHRHHYNTRKNTTDIAKDIEMKEIKVYAHPRKRGPKKKKNVEQMIE